MNGHDSALDEGFCPAVRSRAGIAALGAVVLAAALPVLAAPPLPKSALLTPSSAPFDLRVHDRPAWSRLVASADGGAASRQRAGLVLREMAAAAERWRAVDAGLEVRRGVLGGGVELLRSARGALGPAVPGPNGEDVARAFLVRHGDLFGLGPEQVASLRSRGESRSPSGLRMVRLEQTLDGLPVFQGELRVLLDRDGLCLLEENQGKASRKRDVISSSIMLQTVSHPCPFLYKDICPVPALIFWYSSQEMKETCRYLSLFFQCLFPLYLYGFWDMNS